jgi:hypothetical protein
MKLFKTVGLVGLFILTMAFVAVADTGWGSGAVAESGNTEVMAAADMAAGAMPSGEELCCDLDMPCSCEITCVTLCISTCGCDVTTKDAFVVEFFDSNWGLLASAKLGGEWGDDGCNCGSDCFSGELDKAINPQDVCHVRLTKPGEDNIEIDWFKLKVGSYNECSCKGKWWTVAKCGFCCTEVTGAGAWILNSGW